MNSLQTITAVLSGMGGLALILYGMSSMTNGLQAASGQTFRNAMRSNLRGEITKFSPVAPVR